MPTHRPRVFLTHGPKALANYYGERALSALQGVAEVRRGQHDGPWSSADLADAAHGCAVIVSERRTACDAALLARLPDLLAFCRCAVDLRHVDIAAASEHGVLVTNASAGFMTSVSEWIVGVMLDLSRRISAAAAEYHAGLTPAPTMGRELRDATLGIIGYGQIGRTLADLGLAFGMRVVVADPHAEVANPALRKLTLPALLAKADYVVCLAAATPQTENLMDAAAFAAMKPGAYFVNAARGNLVDEDALLDALEHGTLAGCALDVGRAPDQMPSPQLARHPRVIATPHIGGLTPAAIEHQAMETVQQVADILQGRLPRGAVNGAQATRLRSRASR
jgi:D-3-phosphoglycerate dehydrogenase / 2-oxoglutarate reductase